MTAETARLPVCHRALQQLARIRFVPTENADGTSRPPDGYPLDRIGRGGAWTLLCRDDDVSTPSRAPAARAYGRRPLLSRAHAVLDEIFSFGWKIRYPTQPSSPFRCALRATVDARSAPISAYLRDPITSSIAASCPNPWTSRRSGVGRFATVLRRPQPQ